MVIATCVVSLDNKGIYSQVKCLIKYTNLVIINIYSGRMTREVGGQQTQSVIYSLLNKTPDASPDSASNTSVIYTILSLLNLVKPEQTRRETHARTGTIKYPPVTGDTNGMTRQPVSHRGAVGIKSTERPPIPELSSTVPALAIHSRERHHRKLRQRQSLQPL